MQLPTTLILLIAAGIAHAQTQPLHPREPKIDVFKNIHARDANPVPQAVDGNIDSGSTGNTGPPTGMGRPGRRARRGLVRWV